MSFKEIFNFTNAGWMSQIALLIFLGVFVAVSIRALTRSKKEMNAASHLPLEEGSTQEHKP